MLYVTTRDNKDAFTAHKVLTANVAADGGLYVPFRLPAYNQEEIANLKEKSFGQVVADVLNQFYGSHLSGWDVELAVGKNASKLTTMNHRIVVAELWHNPTGKFSYLVDNLFACVCDVQGQKPTTWFIVSVRIAVLFGLYAVAMQQNLIEDGQAMNIAVPVNDFSAPAAGYYARQMGLPIGTIICTGDENSAVWDLLHRGTFATGGVNASLLLGIERLIFSALGMSEAEKFRSVAENGKGYTVSEEMLPALNEGFFCAVAGESRGSNIINSVYRSNNYILEPETAVCVGGLQDYRARIGESAMTLVLAENTPMDAAKEIMASTGLTFEKLVALVKM